MAADISVIIVDDVLDISRSKSLATPILRKEKDFYQKFYTNSIIVIILLLLATLNFKCLILNHTFIACHILPTDVSSAFKNQPYASSKASSSSCSNTDHSKSPSPPPQPLHPIPPPPSLRLRAFQYSLI